MHFRKDDIVEVISGDTRSRRKERVTGSVLRVLAAENKLVVEGINRVYKHLKPNRRNAQGGRLSKEMPIDVSNVQLFCPTCKRGVRVGYRYDANDGHKERFCRKCGNTLRVMSKPRKAYAGKKA